MKLNIKELKELTSKLSLAVEKSKLNPKSGWIELETFNKGLNFKVSSYDYYLESTITFENEVSSEDAFHVTILAETFIPLISKLDAEEVTVYEKLNSLIIETDLSSYTFPIIKELGETKSVDVIDFEPTDDKVIELNGDDVASIATVNVKGLVNAVFAKEIQQFIYVDNKGALTFTENMYVNEFANTYPDEFKFLLNITQAKLLEIFSGENKVKLQFEHKPAYGDQPTLTTKLCLSTDRIKLVLIAQNQDFTEKFPAVKLRLLSENEEHTHVVLNKKLLDRALARLMVFDKKFDITVLDYSKLVFKQDYLELVSIKNKNSEKIPYTSSQNVVEHESIIRFADLINQLKAVTSENLDISYGSRPAIVINSNIKQIIPEIVVKRV